MNKICILVLCCFALQNCTKNNSTGVISYDHDQKLEGKYLASNNYLSETYFDTLILLENSFYYYKFREKLYNSMGTAIIGYEMVEQIGQWYTKNDSLFMQKNMLVVIDSLGNISWITNDKSDYRFDNLYPRQYLFNTATELWIWNWSNIEKWNRVE